MTWSQRTPAVADTTSKSRAEDQMGPVWSGWREATRVIVYRPHLVKTISVALIVGTILFCINQLNVVLEHKADAVVWLKAGITYLVPFCVSNIGILVATRRAPGPPAGGSETSG